MLSQIASADVVKPALVEISVFTNNSYRAEVRASIEALLTGINAKYRNTQDAPNAEEYDRLRELSPEELAKEFEPFREVMLGEIRLRFDGVAAAMRITEVVIPPRGYTKVPRISVITLEGPVDRSARTLEWYYPARFGDNAVRVRQVNEELEQWHWSTWQWIRDDSVSRPFDLTEVFTQPPITEVIGEYVSAGFAHILPKGLDHILFILGLYLFSIHLRPLFWQITMFTIAHSITLGLAAAGHFQLPDAVVQPLIALSIAYVGVENIWHVKLHRSRLAVIFAFGLLHGVGFASMLSDFGLPDDRFLSALISFNVGVELGQISLILLAFFATGMWFRNKPWYRAVIVIPASATISTIGLYWFWDRLALPAIF